MSADPSSIFFTLFNEVGIINQLSSNRFDQRLPAGLRVSQFGVLNHLVRVGDGKTPVSLANAFQLTKGAMTNTLSILQEKGLVSIKQNPNDGRSKLVFITDAGRETREQAIRDLAKEFAFVAEQIDTEQVLAVIPILQQIRMVLDRHRKPSLE